MDNTPGVCNETTFSITIKNDENVDWTNAKLTVQLPCGFEYKLSTISGATENNITQKNTPIFDIITLVKNVEKNLTFKVLSTCKSGSCIDDGQQFKNDFILIADQGEKRISSDIFNVETPNIIISKVNNSYLENSVGTVTERKITIKNTRLGKTNSFVYKDIHGEIIEVLSDDGVRVNSPKGTLHLIIGPETFSAIGNQDEFFDFNEEVVITEKISIIDCLIEPKFIQSEITTTWGCENVDCKTSLVRATFKALPVLDKGDKMMLSYKVEEPDCYYNSTALQTLTAVISPSISDVTDLHFVIEQHTPNRPIKVGSVVAPPLFTVEYENIKNDSCGVLVAEKVIIIADTLVASETVRQVTFQFLISFCEIPGCDPKSLSWKASYRYVKTCSEENDKNQNGQIVATNISQKPITSAIELLINGMVTNGKAGVIKYVFNSDKLTNAEGEIRVKIEFPAYLQTINSNYAIGSILPQVNEYISGKIKIIELSYPLPFPGISQTIIVPVIANCGDTLLLPCRDTLLTSCADICGFSKTTDFIRGEITLITGTDCMPQGLIKSCADVSFLSECTNGYCYKQLAGYVQYDMEFERTSLGLPDKNGDYIPDEDGEYDLTLINSKNVYLGDTFLIRLNGEVVIDVPGKSFKNAAIQIFHKDIASGPNMGKEILETGISIIHNITTIWDKSTGETYVFENIPTTFDNLQYTFDLSVSKLGGINPVFPDTFVYEDGDSILFKVTKVFNRNFVTPFVGWNGHNLVFKYAPKLLVTNEEILDNKAYFSCGCPETEVNFIGFNAWSQWAIPGVSQCPNSTSSQGILLNFGYPVQSPGEIKYYIRPKGIKIGKVDNIVLDSISLSNGVLPTKTYTTFEDFGDYYYVDISDFTNFRNFRAGLRFWLYRTSETCIGAPIGHTYCEILYDQDPKAVTLLPDKFEYVLQNFSTVPTVALEIQEKEFTALLPQINVPIKIKNQSNGQVRNVFIRPIYDHGSLRDVNLLLSGLPVNYPNINGYFVLGNLFQNENRSLTFRANTNDCGRKRIIFEFGYDCGLYSNPAEEPCFVRYDTMFIDFPEGELEILVDEQEQMGMLCDSMVSSKFTVFNGGLGHLFSIYPSITLPKGVEFVEGSCFIEYPAGSLQEFLIPLPELLFDRTFVWDLKSFWLEHANVGLPAVSSSPDNAFEIRYKTTTDCEFISGSREKISVSASHACGTPSNERTKINGPYIIEGLENEISVQLQVITPDTLFCGLAKKIEVQYINSHITSSTLSIQIPRSVEIVPNSFFGNLTMLDPVIINNSLEWTIPEGTPNVFMSFFVRGKADAGCVRNLIEVSTYSEEEAFCVSNQTLCNIQALSSQFFAFVDIVKPNIQIEDITLHGNQLSPFYTFTSIISHSKGIGPLSAKLYYDRNNDQLITSEDSLMHSFLIDTTDSVDEKITTNTQINLGTLNDFCHFYFVIDSADNCICSPIKYWLGKNIFIAHDTIRLCWDEKATIGIEKTPNKSYQWDFGQGMSCTQCNFADFGVDNDDAFISTWYTRNLEEIETANGCLKTYNYTVEIKPRPRILSTIDPVCLNDTVSLFTTDFSINYFWEGGQIIEDEGSFITLIVDKSEWVFVTMVNELLCFENDSIFIEIEEIEETQFINDGRYCFGDEALIGYVVNENYTYTWIDESGILSDPQSNNSTLNFEQNETIYLEINKGNCSRIDTFQITYYDSIIVTGILDTFFICIGDTLNIELEGAQNYFWGNTFSGECLNDTCSHVRIIPNQIGFLEFTVQASNRFGCKKSLKVNIVSIVNQKVEIEKVTRCAGDTFEYLGQTISQNGLYCDTIGIGGCLIIRCKEVNFLPPVESTLKDTICVGETYNYQNQNLSEEGIYMFTLQTIGGCDSLILLDLTVEPLPNIDLQNTLEIGIGDTTTIFLSTDFTYLWSPSEGLVCDNCNPVKLIGFEDIVYTITITNAAGCYSVRTVSITTKEECNLLEVVLPNAFTPNRDQINDVYSIPMLNNCEVKITIFNRWGNIVYTQNPFDNSWNGMSNNHNELPQGTYYILLESLDGKISRTNMIDLRRQ
ncbi:MAG: gliding motility-associated C-terminal domain-containing protein [Saprospiraceae bacterium]